jgi:SAM-dependent methyltransferase
MSRFYRDDLKLNGMTSPLYLSNYSIFVLDILYNQLLNRPISLLDVGCGSGAQMQRITNTIGEDKFSKRVGIDWSTNTVDLLKTQNIFDEVYHCESNRLPFADKQFDVAMSIENLEHLYADAVIPAIEELCRVATHVVLITPLPHNVINQEWLSKEIPAAEEDPESVDYAEYLVLEGTVHKSTVYPESMHQAGFISDGGVDGHGCYFGISNSIDTTKIKYVGLTENALPEATDFRQHYIKLLCDSKNLKV